MALSLRQYIILFILMMSALLAIFSYQINSNLNETKQYIEASNQKSAAAELTNSINITLEQISSSAKKLSQWQEVTQQISNPEIFAYWYNVRFRQAAFDLQQFTLDLMIYNKSGAALAMLQNTTLPPTIDVSNIDDITYRIINQNHIIYTLPVYDDIDKGEIIGYLSAQIDALPLLLSYSSFEFIKSDSLRLIIPSTNSLLTNLDITNFKYVLIRSEDLNLLEQTIRDSVTSLIIFLVIPAVLVFATLIFIIGIPIKRIDSHINMLRENPDLIDTLHDNSGLQLKELNKVYDSLNRYHHELLQNEENLSLTLNSIGEAVITTDKDNRIIRMNPVAENLTGWSEDNAFGLEVDKVIKLQTPDSNDSITEPLYDCLTSGERIHIDKDIILLSNSNQQHYIALSASPIQDSNNETYGIVFVFNDISEQKHKDEQLQQSMKMDALGKLTGGIAHDFNNLLGVIIGYSELLISLQESAKDKSLEYAQAIFKAGVRGQKLTQRLLAFSRKQATEPRLCNINQVLLDDQALLEKTLTARIQLIYQLQPDLWPTYLDINILQDAILNICINAMHAMPDGGKLTISTRNVLVNTYSNRQLQIPFGDYACLRIHDTGIGISKVQRSKIFDPFFTTKGDQGTGLGLSQVYGFIQQSGGAIIVDSEPGKGTFFELYFPRNIDNLDDAPDTREIVNQRPQPISVDKTILIVDDEENMLSLTSSVLKDAGYNILTATSSSEALELLASFDIDLVLTDIIMPEMDGFELATRISELYPDILIQFVSGYSEEKNLPAALKALYEHKLSKPFRKTSLLQRISDLLGT